MLHHTEVTMFSCRDICDNATNHLEGSLNLGQRLQMRLHLLICDACRRFYAQLQLTIGVSAKLGKPPEPSEEEIEAVAQKLMAKT